MPLEDGMYDAVKNVPHALELKPSEIERLDRKYYAHGTVKDSEVWIALADGNKYLVAEYDEAQYELVGNNEHMPHYFGHASRRNVTARLLYVSDCYFNSLASCSKGMSISRGRLFGVVPAETLADKLI